MKTLIAISALIPQTKKDSPVYISKTGSVLTENSEDARFVIYQTSAHPINPSVYVQDKYPTDGCGISSTLDQALGFMAKRILWG